MNKKITRTLIIAIDGKNCSKECQYSGKTRYAQPGAMHLPPEEYWVNDWCQLFKTDLKTNDYKTFERCDRCLEE